MSTDPSSPSHDPHIEGNASTPIHDSTEIDLWDLDADQNTSHSRFDNPEGSAGKIPAQRGSVSRIQSRKPADLRPILAETDEIFGSHPVPAEAYDRTPAPAEPQPQSI
jgi:hypothetical protein